jgi:hypothetical protein
MVENSGNGRPRSEFPRGLDGLERGPYLPFLYAATGIHGSGACELMMRGRKKNRGAWVGGGIVVAAICLAVLFSVQRESAPTASLLAAEQYLNLAREAKADYDAPENYRAAVEKARQARSAMMVQFGRPPFLRDYGKTRRLILDAQNLTAETMEVARKEAADRQAKIDDSIRQIRSEAADIRELLLRLPGRYHIALRHVFTAEARVRAAEAKLDGRESAEALEALGIARGEMNLALQNVRGLLQKFLERRPEWNTDLHATLAWSRRTGSVAVVVDKLNHRVHIVRGGESVENYPAEFGPGWLDQKIRAGDSATPEGRYRIVRKKGNGQSRYYKACLLDYPNDEDRRRFSRLTTSGMMSRSARIGGLIEIHGEGGKGQDWTLGCISLRNDHLDRIFSKLSVGTPVTIVGLWTEPTWLTRTLQTANR